MNPLVLPVASTNGRTSLPTLVVLFASLFLVTWAQGSNTVTFRFQEEQNPKAYVGNFAMEARQNGFLSGGDFSLLRFYTYQSEYFAINQTTGAVTTVKRIDREKICSGTIDCEISVEVTVYKADQNDNLDLYKIMNFIVTVEDLNDNAPTFPSPTVSLSIPEGNKVGAVLRTSGAIDKDTGEGNSVKQYRFQNAPGIFSLTVIKNPDGSSYLGIVVKEELNREEKDFYQLTIIATDGGFPEKSGQVVINITVTDTNDNPPVFLKTSYNESVKENIELNVPIMAVKAKDLDSGRRAEITYHFSSQVSEKVREKLYIDQQTGEILAHNPIDYEEDKLFQFVVEALDHGLPQHISRVGVTLHVLDVNDNSPQININLSPTGTAISELEPVGKFIAHVSVLDRDEGINKVVLCDLDDDYFSLDKFANYESNMYKVILRKHLDHEYAARHRVTITCTDNGNPPRSNSSSFVVNVIDENDNRPAFTEPAYYGDVIENKAGEIYVMTPIAHDWDSGDNGMVSYSLEDKYSGLFKINNTSGAITVFGPLDREATREYRFHVIAMDQSKEKLSSSSLAIVTVLDENDEPPRFPKPVYFGDVLENQPSGTPVGNVTALDKDDVKNSQMKYSIVSGDSDDGQSFSINHKSGVIKSKTVFDKEQKSHYQFRIRVVDPTKTNFVDFCNFTVRVLDDNDHAPVIRTPKGDNMTFVIDYSTEVGSLITKIEASDGDASDSKHSQLVYFMIKGDPEQLFNLNRFTGSLTLARMMRVDDPTNYHLVIRVQDGGDPPQFDMTELVVKINGTMPQTASSTAGLSHNILIVVILVGVTIVLGLAIMTAICLVKKIDRERRRSQNSNGKKFEDKMYHIKQEEIFTRAAIDLTVDDPNANKRGKKEVSFSFDEDTDSHNTSNGSGQPLTTSFRSGGDKVKSNGHYGLGNSRVGNRLGSDMNIPVDNSEKQNNQQRRPPHDEESHLIEILRKTGEDALSESSGESDPSDSGRGGSEDDSSNRGSGLDPEHNNGLYPPMYHRGSHGKDIHQLQHQPYQPHLYPPQSRGRQGSHGKGRQQHQLNRLSPVTQNSPRDSLSSGLDSDMSYVRNRSSQCRTDSDRSASRATPTIHEGHHRPSNDTVALRGSRDHINRRTHVSRDSPHRLSAPYNMNNLNNMDTMSNSNTISNSNPSMRSFQRQPSSNHSYNNNNIINNNPNRIMSSFSMERLPHAHHHPSNNITSDRSRSTTPSERGSRHRAPPERYVSMPVGDRRMTHMSPTEEEDRTTTSGSYSINQDEIRHEIDDLIMHDSIV